ncbi:SDR family NAD(P)-dependent oxidoreductase [Corynebacterium sp. NPDC060344]|uniref:SDR family NAD(P)-dependent oxidoreductase n=1 Tax=Corynebacterium sp. NPDC060344 TaxID=3347101 RepID=UPI0036674352
MTAPNTTSTDRTRLTGAIAVVVGARGGIGTRVVAKLRAAGATVVAADLPDVDASDPASLAALLDDVARRHHRIDVLVHAAGMVSNEDFGARTTQDVDAELAVNLASPMHLVRMALPLLKKGRLHEVVEAPGRRGWMPGAGRRRRKPVRSHVIVLGSLGGVMPMPDQAVYAAGKFGLRGAMLSLGMSLRGDGIAVTSVLPSSVDTPMLWREVAEDGNALQFLGPPQSPETIADAALGVIGRHVAEVFPNRVDGVLARAAMLAPGLLPHILPRLEPLGRRGMARYRAELVRRGDLPPSTSSTRTPGK